MFFVMQDSLGSSGDNKGYVAGLDFKLSFEELFAYVRHCSDIFLPHSLTH